MKAEWPCGSFKYWLEPHDMLDHRIDTRIACVAILVALPVIVLIAYLVSNQHPKVQLFKACDDYVSSVENDWSHFRMNHPGFSDLKTTVSSVPTISIDVTLSERVDMAPFEQYLLERHPPARMHVRGHYGSGDRKMRVYDWRYPDWPNGSFPTFGNQPDQRDQPVE